MKFKFEGDKNAIRFFKNGTKEANETQHVKFRQIALICLFAITSLFFVQETISQRHMEFLGRGLVAVKQTDRVFLSWRIFATDTMHVAFNLYRDTVLVNPEPIVGKSNYVDAQGDENSTYYLETIYDSSKTEITAPVSVWKTPYLTIPLQTPASYSPNDCSVGDLDGDGEYEIVVKMEGITHDNAHSGNTDPVFLHAYEFDGTLLWSIDLGVNIRAGAHYTQFMVYDLDSDGLAEVACKTAPGTKDGTGEYLSIGPAADDDDSKKYRNSSGYILSGPEYLTVFDGLTGTEVSTVDYVPVRSPLSTWGDTYGNRVDRFLACVAYFDSIPSLVMCRGYYDRTSLTAWDLVDRELVMRWKFDTEDDLSNLRQYEGQGAHSIAVGDVDSDGKDEIMYGAIAFDDDGSPLYNTKFCHGDATHLGDLVPGSPGQEFYMPSESANWTHDGVTNPAIHVRNAATGEVVWKIMAEGDIGRAMTADISAAHPGNEFWAASGLGVYNSSGKVISGSRPPINFAAWWDGDLLREMLDGTRITKWGGSTLLSASGCYSNNGSKSTPAISGDLIGDWREEVVFRTTDNKSLRLYTTTIPTEHGLYTLMQDPQYRQAIAWQNVAYNQPPHPSFFLGHGMDTPPVPDIKVFDPRYSPIINIASPKNGIEHYLGMDLNIVVQAIGLSDTNQMVILFDGETPLDTIYPPYKTNLKNLQPGTHSLVAAAFNIKGQMVKSKPTIITVDEGYPHISIEEPISNTDYMPGDSIMISANAFDTDGSIDSIAVYMNNIRQFVMTDTPFVQKIGNLDLGIYEITAIAYDNETKATISDISEIGVGMVSTIQENSVAFCGFTDDAGIIDNTNPGFMGTGYLNPDNISGAQANWGIYFQVPGNYMFVWRYSATSALPGKLKIGGISEVDVPFQNTGGLDKWAIASANAQAERGFLKITLEATSDGGLPNIDYLKTIPVDTESPAVGKNCIFLPTGMDEIFVGKDKGLDIYPVPARNYINIKLIAEYETIKSIAIYNMDGSRIHFMENKKGNQTRISLHSIPNGIYIIRLATNANYYTKKIVVSGK